MKKILITIYIILFLAVIGYGAYELFFKKSSINVTQDSLIKDFKLKKVDNYNTFFSLSNNVNNFYKLIFEDKDKAVELLSDDYISVLVKDDKDIQKNIIKDYSSISFIPKKAYSKGIKNTQYYFINGTLRNVKDGLITYENINIVLINDLFSKTFSINILDEDLESILNNYVIKDVRISSNSANSFKYYSFSERDVTLIYINYIRENIYFDTENIYNMFKSNYSELKEFTNNIEDIINLLNDKMKFFSKKNNVFNIGFNNDKKVKIIEKDIMDFTVEL